MVTVHGGRGSQRRAHAQQHLAGPGERSEGERRVAVDHDHADAVVADPHAPAAVLEHAADVRHALAFAQSHPRAVDGPERHAIEAEHGVVGRNPDPAALALGEARHRIEIIRAQGRWKRQREVGEPPAVHPIDARLALLLVEADRPV